MLPVDRTEITPEEFEEIRRRAGPVHEVLRDIMPPDMHYLISENNGQK